MSIGRRTVNEVQEQYENEDDVKLIDVREVDEFTSIASPYAKNFPLSEFDVDEVAKSLDLKQEDSTPLYFICAGGVRSLRAAELFQDAGFTNVHNVEGGMNEWIRVGLPTTR